MGYSVSCTTRDPRPAEKHATDYFFLTREEFVAARERGEFAESAEVHGQLYGTLRREVDRVLSAGRHVVMDIDVQGAKQFVEAYPASVLVFILPPDSGALLERLSGRGTEEKAAIERRLKSALAELQAIGMYHYVVINEDLDKAVEAISEIIDAEAMRTSRISGLNERVGELVAGLEKALTNNKGSN